MLAAARTVRITGQLLLRKWHLVMVQSYGSYLVWVASKFKRLRLFDTSVGGRSVSGPSPSVCAQATSVSVRFYKFRSSIGSLIGHFQYPQGRHKTDAEAT
jgi:hypothetical protein